MPLAADDSDAPEEPPPRYAQMPSDTDQVVSHQSYNLSDASAPPQWEASAGESQLAKLYPYGIYHDAGRNHYERGVRFCELHPNVDVARYISHEQLDWIRTRGVGAWSLTPPSRFDGSVTRDRDGTLLVRTGYSSDLDKTLVSSLPVLWGKYSPHQNAKGVYYEVEIEKLGRHAVVAVGFGCLPYPTDFRLPGWHRHSAAVHSDDGFKFFENPDGGVPFINPIKKKGAASIK